MLENDNSYCFCMEKFNAPFNNVVSNCWLLAVNTLTGDAKEISASSCLSSSLGAGPVAGVGLGCAAGSALITVLAFVLLRRWRRRRRVRKQWAVPAPPIPAPPYAYQYSEHAGSKSRSTPHGYGAWNQHPGTPMSLPYHEPQSSQPVPSTLELPATPIEPSTGIWQGPGKAEVPAVGNSGPQSDIDLGIIREDTISPIRHLSPTPAPRRARSREPDFEMVTKQSMSSIRDEGSSEKDN